MNPLDSQVAVTLLAFLVAGVIYASWFKRIRAAMGFIVLFWFTLGLSGVLFERFLIGTEFPDMVRVAQFWLPWNLILLAFLPYRPLRSSWVLVAVLVMLAELVVPFVVSPEFLNSAFNADSWLLGQLPAAIAAWMTPVSSILMVVASLLFFARWQITNRPNELSLSLMSTLLLAGMLRPNAVAVWVAAAGVVLLLAVLYSTHRMAFIDALTSLPNRRALNEALISLPKQCALAMLDVDHFKRINDRFGHDFGDQVLRTMSARLKRVRGFQAFRYGGEEFCLVFKGSKTEQAEEICEQARRVVSASPIVIRGHDRPGRKPINKSKFRNKVPSVKVTVSIGLANIGPNEKPEALIERADKALYKAKGAGRDRVVVAKNKAVKK